MVIGRQAIADLARRYGTQYVVGNVAETICKHIDSYHVTLVNLRYKL